MNSTLLSINIGLLVSHAFKYYCHGTINDYKKDLTGDLLAKYEKINTERLTHFIIGVVIAFAVSLIYYLKLSDDNSTLQIINTIAFIMLLLPVVIYTVLPKSDYMLNHSQSDQDYKDWFNIYLCMKNKGLQGFLVGFAITMFVMNFMITHHSYETLKPAQSV